MQITITYDEAELVDYQTVCGFELRTKVVTRVEVYTLSAVAMARVKALQEAGINCSVKTNNAPIIVCE